MLKSGCKVEELQHHTAERLERAMAIKMVIGWRIQLMVQLGREVPELPGDLLFSDGELRVLATFARSRKLPAPARLGDAVGLVGRLGGWLGRRCRAMSHTPRCLENPGRVRLGSGPRDEERVIGTER